MRVVQPFGFAMSYYTSCWMEHPTMRVAMRVFRSINKDHFVFVFVPHDEIITSPFYIKNNMFYCKNKPYYVLVVEMTTREFKQFRHNTKKHHIWWAGEPRPIRKIT